MEDAWIEDFHCRDWRPGWTETLETRKKGERKQSHEGQCGLTAVEARLGCGGGHEGMGVGVVEDGRVGCWRWSMDAEERGCRTGSAAVGDVMLLPRLWNLLSLRWYSIGDWRATGETGTRQNAVQFNSGTQMLSPSHR